MNGPAGLLQIRDFAAADAAPVNALAVAAFAPFAPHHNDWPAMAVSLAKMSELSATAEVIVAAGEGGIVGAVADVPPGAPKPAFFNAEWPTIRMLVVDPAARGRGIGRALTQECVACAARDGAKVVALHTSPIMTVALPMYLRMGFARLRDAPPFLGVDYAVYTKAL
jgi:ribosomal protein S18 acetylase RimI-like enzyme